MEGVGVVGKGALFRVQSYTLPAQPAQRPIQLLPPQHCPLSIFCPPAPKGLLLREGDDSIIKGRTMSNSSLWEMQLRAGGRKAEVVILQDKKNPRGHSKNRGSQCAMGVSCRRMAADTTAEEAKLRSIITFTYYYV